MSSSMPNKDIRTVGYILRRTNYGEADRILNIITPLGKISAIAKGVRREKSRLAGGVEMFSLVSLNIHQGRGELGIVTSAKMKKYYSEILKNFNKIELATLILKKINLAADGLDNAEYFELVNQGLEGINDGLLSELVESWFFLNLLRVSGEDVNLYRDTDGKLLSSEKLYSYDVLEKAFRESARGEYGAMEIKALRFMVTNKLIVVSRIKKIDSILPKILQLARIMSGAV